MISRVAAIKAVVEALATSAPEALDQPPQDFISSFESAPLSGEDAASRAHALRVAEYCGLLSGLLGFGPGWDPTGTLSRGETAQLVHAAMNTVPMPAYADETGVTQRDERDPWWLVSATDPACASDDELTSGFVPDAQEALDGLLDGLVVDDVPSDTEAITIDGAAMRTVIAKMRADRSAREGKEAHSAGDEQIEPSGDGQTPARRYPNLRMGWPPAKVARDRVHDRAPS